MPQIVSSFKPDRFPLYVAGIEAVKEYREAQKVRQAAPRVRLVISPFIPPFLPIEFLGEDLGDLIQSVTFEKSRSQPAGNFNVVLAADDASLDQKVSGQPLGAIWRMLGASMRDLFKPMTLAYLYMDGYLIATGKLSAFQKSVSAGRKVYVAQFDELGIIYEQNIMRSTEIIYGQDRHVVNDPASVFNMTKDGTIISMMGKKLTGVTAAEAIQNLAKAFMVSTMNYGTKGFGSFRLSDGKPLPFRMIADASPIGALSNNTILNTITTDASLFTYEGGGSFWSFLKSLAPEPYIEMWTETGGRTICLGPVGAGISAGSIINAAKNPSSLAQSKLNIAPMLPGFNYLVFRSAPYNNPLIGVGAAAYKVLESMTMGVFDLMLTGDFVIVTDDDVVSKTLGWSDANQFTVFHANMSSKGDGNMTSGTNRPSIANGPLLPLFPGGIKTFGWRSFEAPIPAYNLAWEGLIAQSISETSKRSGASPVNASAISQLLNYWFRNASKFIEGTITTRWMPYARPGMVLLYLPPLSGTDVEDPREIGIYYIDNLSHEYTIGKAPTTSFTVCRGTPLPMSMANLGILFMDWEIFPVGPNMFDGEFP